MTSKAASRFADAIIECIATAEGNGATKQEILEALQGAMDMLLDPDYETETEE